ncbi:MAG: exosortase/archaeosortase family protein [Armatimonadota bacterium]
MATPTVDAVKEKQKTCWPSVEDIIKHKLWFVIAFVWAALIAITYLFPFKWWWGEWWRDESYYSHGILIPIMSGFIIWFNWNRIKKIHIEPSIWGFVIILPMLFLNYKAQVSSLASIGGITFPIMLVGMALLLFGKAVVRELLFPAGFLYFMVVPPTSILEPLSFKIQIASTNIAVMGLHLLGLDAVQTGTQIQLPNGLPMVVGAPCSGFRMLIALLAFTVFFVFMKKGPKWGKLSMVAIVLPLSLLANSVRVLMIALVGEYYGEDAMHAFHDYSGYIVLVITFAVLVLFAKVVKCRDFKSMPA